MAVQEEKGSLNCLRPPSLSGQQSALGKKGVLKFGCCKKSVVVVAAALGRRGMSEAEAFLPSVAGHVTPPPEGNFLDIKVAQHYFFEITLYF